MTSKDIARFIQNIEKTEGCWKWAGSKDKLGYGYFNLNGTSQRAHRVSYEFFTQTKIPFGKVIDHLCRNTSCVNPKHLEPVTLEKNTLRGESPSAKFARATHCSKGHPLKGDNLKVRVRNRRAWRVCKTCKNEIQKIYMLKKYGRPIGKQRISHI